MLQEDWGLGTRAAISPVCLPAKLYKDDDNIAFTLGTGLKYKVGGGGHPFLSWSDFLSAKHTFNS